MTDNYEIWIFPGECRMIAHIIKYGERAKIQNDTYLKNLVLVHFKVQNDHFLCEV